MALTYYYLNYLEVRNQKLSWAFFTNGDKQAKKFLQIPVSDAVWHVILHSPASQSPECPWRTSYYCMSRI